MPFHYLILQLSGCLFVCLIVRLFRPAFLQCNGLSFRPNSSSPAAASLPAFRQQGACLPAFLAGCPCACAPLPCQFESGRSSCCQPATRCIPLPTQPNPIPPAHPSTQPCVVVQRPGCSCWHLTLPFMWLSSCCPTFCVPRPPPPASAPPLILQRTPVHAHCTAPPSAPGWLAGCIY